MTELRECLADVLRVFRHEPMSSEQLVDVLLSLPGIAIMELPKLSKDDLDHQYWIWIRDDGIYFHGDHEPSSPQQAREFAAALLAAADMVEREAK